MSFAMFPKKESLLNKLSLVGLYLLYISFCPAFVQLSRPKNPHNRQGTTLGGLFTLVVL
jgi:hypothetical protein